MSNKFKLAIENTKKVYGDVFARYPVSTILVFISTIYASIYVILEEKNVFFHTVSQAILWWLLFFVYSTVGAFGIEALPEKFFETNKKIKKTVGILIMEIISGILVSVTLGLILGIAESETLKHINAHSLLAWNMAYSIFTRINEYGITPSRYMGVVLIVLEVIYTLVYAFARKHIDKVILVMMAVTVVVTLIPGINVNATSERSQKATIVKFIKNGLPSNYKEQERLKGAYFYLRDEFGDDYMEKLLDSDDIEELRTLDDRINNEEPREYSLHSDIPFVDAKGYDYVARFQNSYYMQDYPDENIDCSALELSVDGKVLCTIDYTDEVDSIIKRASKDERYRIEGADVMKVSDDCELVITYAEIDKDLVTDKIFHVQFNGYIKFNETFFDVRRFEEE